MFEVRSIAYVTTVNLVIIALGFFIQWLRERDPSLRDWAIGFAIGALGCALSSIRDFVSDLLSVAVSGAMLILVYVYTYWGLCRHFGTRPSRWVAWLPVVTLALYTYFIAVNYSPGVWPMITGYARVVICAVIFMQLMQHRAQMSHYASVLLLASMLLMGVFMFGRASITPWLTQTSDFTASSAPAITYFVTAACTIAMMMGLLSLHVDRLLIKLEDAANTDVLTGLRNRRCFNELALRELERSSRGKQPLWLLMLDIDHFKKINDSYGHDEGDRILKEVGKALGDSVRSYDIVARYGGEEFCVLLPNTATADAKSTAQRLLHSVAKLRVGPQRYQPVTISIGAAAQGEGGSDLEDLVKRADIALYDAKRNGRNRVVGFSGD